MDEIGIGFRSEVKVLFWGRVKEKVTKLHYAEVKHWK